MSLTPVRITGVSSLSKPARQLGQSGEAHAAAFLQEHGFRILYTNYHTRYGELDIVAERDGIFHCVEVKTRRTTTFGVAMESIAEDKQQRWINAIHTFLEIEKITAPYQADIITLELQSGQWKTNWVQNVLEDPD